MPGFCTLCNLRLMDFRGHNKCPQCGTSSTPCADSQQVQISINIQELRVLLIWAEGFALGDVMERSGLMALNQDLVYAIANRIRRQLPDGGTMLTFTDQLEQMDRDGEEYTSHHPAADSPELSHHYEPKEDSE